jgi:hypothetical protein
MIVPAKPAEEVADDGGLPRLEQEACASPSAVSERATLFNELNSPQRRFMAKEERPRRRPRIISRDQSAADRFEIFSIPSIHWLFSKG